MNNRGSTTLEAAIVLPLFIFALLTYVSIIQFYRIDSDIQGDITKTAMEQALYGASADVLSVSDDLVDSGFVATVISDGYAYSQLYSDLYGDNGQAADTLSHELTPLNFIFSGVSEESDIIDITVSYYVTPKFNVYGVGDVLLVNRARVHKWSGYSTEKAEGDEDRIVYITDTGTVYHLTKTCPYLKLSISMVDYEDIKNAKNKSGNKYSACSTCKPGKKGKVYITDYGDKYHGTLKCSGLKRTIKEIKLSETGGMKACSKCGG